MFGYVPKHYQLYELVPRTLYETVPHDTLWKIFDPELLYFADWLRDKYGRMVCNTWHWGGINHYRGYRPPQYAACAEYSMHRFGKALDLIPVDASVETIHAHIKAASYLPVYGLIRRVENVPWLHIDRANCPGHTRPYFFNP